jgi:hypothetical protein
MNMLKRNFAIAAGLAGAMALTTSASAAPVTSSTAALKNAAPSDVVQVRSRGWRRAGVAAGIGFAAGTLIGAAASSHAYAYSDPYWYGHSYGYAPAYSYAYAYEPDYVYAAPAPTFVEPAPVYAGPAPIVRSRRVVADPFWQPAPTVFAGPQPVYPRQLFLDANPALGTVQGASGID